MKKSTAFAVCTAAAAAAGNAVHALCFKPKAEKAAPIAKEEENLDRFRKNLSDAIKIKTIAGKTSGETDFSSFERFHALLDERYPLTAQRLEKEIVPPANLIYRWRGANPALDPVGLCAHQDVVPVTEGTESDWVHGAFSGEDDGESIWGRGSLDMKNHLIAVMESVETLLEQGFQPERDVYLLFGDNEEVVGSDENGAKSIMTVLQKRGVHFDALLDEGGAMLPVNVKGVIENKYLAGVGIAEKGYADIEITLGAKGGHSSQPPKHTALGEMAEVIRDLENHQFKASLSSSMKSLIDSVARNCTYPVRLLACNLPVLYPALLQAFKLIPPAACMVRTTTGVTMAQGSPAANVLPQRASITVNFRAMPGTTTDDIVKHIKKVVRNKNIEITVHSRKEASAFSPTDSRAFGIISRICRGIEPSAIVAPYLLMGGTDSCHYEPICENIYRYAPFKLNSELLSCMHGTNERLPLSCAEDALLFFREYIKQVSAE